MTTDITNNDAEHEALPTSDTGTVETIKIGDLNLTDGIQSRASINDEVVEEYASLIGAGTVFPPIRIIRDPDGTLRVVDGFHRLMAAKLAGVEEIKAEIIPGDRKMATESALRANIVHGLRRSNADKRHAVRLALSEFSDLTSRTVAEMCGVGNHLVDEVRREMTEGGQLGESPNSNRKGKDNKSYPARKPTRKSAETGSGASAAVNPGGDSAHSAAEAPTRNSAMVPAKSGVEQPVPAGSNAREHGADDAPVDVLAKQNRTQHVRSCPAAESRIPEDLTPTHRDSVPSEKVALDSPSQHPEGDDLVLVDGTTIPFRDWIPGLLPDDRVRNQLKSLLSSWEVSRKQENIPRVVRTQRILVGFATVVNGIYPGALTPEVGSLPSEIDMASRELQEILQAIKDSVCLLNNVIVTLPSSLQSPPLNVADEAADQAAA